MLTRAGTMFHSWLRLVAAVGAATGAAQAQDIQLGLPIDCQLGKTCWVQQYVDHDPGRGVRDYACGAQTYDGHDGTDIRIQDTAERGIDVLAAAPGTVKAARGDMPDLLIRSNEDRSLVRNRECGNGVVVDHAGGWQTQYCHMRVGSLKVEPGEEVERGTHLGEVGYSGAAQFPHVHLTVRKDGKPIDPFSPDDATSGCGSHAQSLWAPDASAALAYRNGEVIGLGFAPEPVKVEALEEGALVGKTPTKDWPALVAYGWAINLEKGDAIKVTLDGPAGSLAENSATLDRNKAQYMLFAGRTRPQEGWPKGAYAARIAIVRNGAPALSREFRARLD